MIAYHTTRATRPGDAGFTLVEIMLAIGILAIGLVMVAAAFPTAIELSRRTAEETNGMVIAENARTIVLQRLRHSFNQAENIQAGRLYQLNEWPLAARRFQAGDREYPIDSGEDYGWLVLGRRVDPNNQNRNDYQFVIVPYRKFPGAPDPALVPLAGVDAVAIDGPQRTGTFSNAKDLAIGAPLIRANDPNPADAIDPTGLYAFITSQDDTDPQNRRAILSGNLGETAQTNLDVWTVPNSWNTDSLPGNDVLGGSSPAIGCYMFRMSLQVAPPP